MGRTRWPLAIATALALVVAPGARAQEKQPTANGTGGAASSVDPLATQAAIDVLAGGGNAFDAAVAAAGVLGVVEPYSCGIGGGGFMVHPRRRQRPDHDDRLAREGPGGDEARQLLHQRQAADGRAVPAQPLQRAERRRPGHARGVGLPAQELRHDQPRARRSATASTWPPTASWSTRRSTTRRPATRPTSTTSRRARRSTSTPTARRRTSARSSRTRTWPGPTAGSGASARPRASTPARRRRDRQVRRAGPGDRTATSTSGSPA